MHSSKYYIAIARFFVEEITVSVSLKMLFSVMDSTQGPTPILLIDDNTLINDEKWLLEYIETALHSFNIIGGFFKGEIQNRRRAF